MSVRHAVADNQDQGIAAVGKVRGATIVAQVQPKFKKLLRCMIHDARNIKKLLLQAMDVASLLPLKCYQGT